MTAGRSPAPVRHNESRRRPITRVCIVTPQLIGPSGVKEIGIHCGALARFLAEDERFDVTVLYSTDRFENGGPDTWKKRYSEIGITLASIGDLPKPVCPVRGSTTQVQKSIIIYEFLKNMKFDFIHFQDMNAEGFRSIQAKRTGLGFSETTLTVTMHGPSQWRRTRMEETSPHPVRDVITGWCERYCARYADLLISPTRYMLRWADENGWETSRNSDIVPLCYIENSEPPGRESPAFFPDLVFYGSPRIAHGLRLFCDSVDDCLSAEGDFLCRVCFALEDRAREKDRAHAYIRKWARRHRGLSVETVSADDVRNSLRHLKENGGTAVIMPRLDNSPYAVLDCIENRIPFLAPATGGIPELVSDTRLFAPDAGSLSTALLSRESAESLQKTDSYTSGSSKEAWLLLHEKKPAVVHVSASKPAVLPMVSVIIPFFNHGRHLPALLHSIVQSDYGNFEVIVINDGSTVAFSNEIFREMKKKYSPLGWRFYEKSNTGPGDTRNFAAEKARGEYLVFMDSDNIATGGMISDFVRGMAASGCDCLTCFYHAFEKESSTLEGEDPLYTMTPIGGSTELGCVFNVFGDTNFVIKKDVYLTLGGFAPRFSHDDWEFLVRLNFAGYSQDIIPKIMFHYRILDESFVRSMSRFKVRHTIARHYYMRVPDYLRFFYTEHCVPVHRRHGKRRRREAGKSYRRPQGLGLEPARIFSHLENSKSVRFTDAVVCRPFLLFCVRLVFRIFYALYRTRRVRNEKP